MRASCRQDPQCTHRPGVFATPSMQIDAACLHDKYICTVLFFLYGLCQTQSRAIPDPSRGPCLLEWEGPLPKDFTSPLPSKRPLLFPACLLSAAPVGPLTSSSMARASKRVHTNEIKDESACSGRDPIRSCRQAGCSVRDRAVRAATSYQSITLTTFFLPLPEYTSTAQDVMRTSQIIHGWRFPPFADRGGKPLKDTLVAPMISGPICIESLS